MNCFEPYFVLDWLASVVVEGEDVEIEPEGFVLVSRGAEHALGNDGAVEARLLGIHTPAMDVISLLSMHCGAAPKRRLRTRNEERAFMARLEMEAKLSA